MKLMQFWFVMLSSIVVWASDPKSKDFSQLSPEDRQAIQALLDEDERLAKNPHQDTAVVPSASKGKAFDLLSQEDRKALDPWLSGKHAAGIISNALGLSKEVYRIQNAAAKLPAQAAKLPAQAAKQPARAAKRSAKPAPQAAAADRHDEPACNIVHIPVVQQFSLQAQRPFWATQQGGNCGYHAVFNAISFVDSQGQNFQKVILDVPKYTEFMNQEAPKIRAARHKDNISWLHGHEIETMIARYRDNIILVEHVADRPGLEDRQYAEFAEQFLVRMKRFLQAPDDRFAIIFNSGFSTYGSTGVNSGGTHWVCFGFLKEQGRATIFYMDSASRDLKHYPELEKVMCGSIADIDARLESMGVGVFERELSLIIQKYAGDDARGGSIFIPRNLSEQLQYLCNDIMNEKWNGIQNLPKEVQSMLGRIIFNILYCENPQEVFFDFECKEHVQRAIRLVGNDVWKQIEPSLNQEKMLSMVDVLFL